MRDREQFIAEVRERLAEKRRRVAAPPEAPGADEEFEAKYRYLVEGLRRIFEEIDEPGLEVEDFGSSGLRISFLLPDPSRHDAALVEREIRISRVDATGEVHLVFSSFQRAERHATFKLTRPRLAGIEAAFVEFLIEGREPGWVSRRRRAGGSAAGHDDDAGGPEAEGQGELELPFD